jgi:hypothetical protein
MLLVMNAQGVLVPPSVGKTQMWDLTWQKVDRVMPKLRAEVFPQEPRSSRDGGNQSTRHVEA